MACRSVGRSVGRSAGCVGVGVSQCAENPGPSETSWPELPPDTLGHRCCDEPCRQMEAQSAEGRGSHMRSFADLGPFEGRTGSSGGAHAEVCAAIHGAGRTMGIEAPTRSRATTLAGILPALWQRCNGWVACAGDSLQLLAEVVPSEMGLPQQPLWTTHVEVECDFFDSLPAPG